MNSESIANAPGPIESVPEIRPDSPQFIDGEYGSAEIASLWALAIALFRLAALEARLDLGRPG